MTTTKKKVVKKKPVLEEVKALTEAEMLKIDLATKEQRIIELEIVAITNKKKVMDLEFNSEIEKKRNLHRQYVERKDNLIKGLEKKYNLQTGLSSYDPLTGEIRDE